MLWFQKISLAHLYVDIGGGGGKGLKLFFFTVKTQVETI